MKKAFLAARNFFELFIPVVSFTVMFVTFILQVFFRYALKLPLTWTQDIIVLCFVWTVIFGACWTMRNKAHVKFTMVYDRLAPKPAAMCRLAGNAIITLTFLSLVIASWNYSFFVGYQKTAVFRVPYTVMFLPFVYFLVSITGYTVVEIVEDIKVIAGRLSDSADHQAAETREAKK